MLDAYQGTCDAFVQAIKEHNPTLREFGPTSAYNTERCEAFNSLVRCQNVHSNRHNPSRDIAVGFSVREHMLSQEVAMDQTMNGGIESAKERKLAMLIQATVMINAKQSGIGERQRGKLMDGTTPSTHLCLLSLVKKRCFNWNIVQLPSPFASVLWMIR
eukprot:Em0005g1237a